MKNFRMENPCQVNLDVMKPTQNGVFCDQCAVDVYDFTNKSSEEIRAVLLQQSNKAMCGRYTEDQIESLNTDFEAWKFDSQRSVQRAMLFSLIVVFGLTLFSCTNQKDANTLSQIQEDVTRVIEAETDEVSEIVVEQNQVKEVVSIELLDEILEEEIAVPVEVVDVVSIEEPLVRTINSYQIDGGVRWSSEYDVYLEEIVPTEGVLDVELDVDGVELPIEFSTLAYPNPAREQTTLKVALPIDQEMVVINLFSMSGSLVSTVHSGGLNRGAHEIGIDLLDLKPGIYLATVISADFKETVRISKN